MSSPSAAAHFDDKEALRKHRQSLLDSSLRLLNVSNSSVEAELRVARLLEAKEAFQRYVELLNVAQ